MLRLKRKARPLTIEDMVRIFDDAFALAVIKGLERLRYGRTGGKVEAVRDEARSLPAKGTTDRR